MGTTLGQLATILLITILFLVGINQITNDVSNNSNLDLASQELLSDINSDYNSNYLANETFEVGTSNITSNSTFAGVDAFSRQYLEDKSANQEREGVVDRVLGLPQLFLTMFGVTNTTILILWSTAIYSFLTFLIGLAIYKSIRTGEVD